MSDGTDEALAGMTPTELQRFEALRVAAPGIALELGNVMTVVLGCLEQLRRQSLDDGGRTQLQHAEAGARQVTRLIRQALALACHESGQAQVVDLNEAVRGIDKILTHTAGENVEVAFELAHGPLLTRLEVARLELALLSLVRNARDVMGSAGRIIVRTSGHPVERLDAQPTIELSVTITGVAPTALQEPGDDMGLAMASCFVSSCGGKVAIETATGGGTTVRLVFPRASENL